LVEEHYGLVAKCETGERQHELRRRSRHRNTWQGVAGVPLAEAGRRQAVTDRDSVGTQVAGKAGETQTAADVSAQINDNTVAAPALEIPNCQVECVREANPCGTGEVGNLEDPGFGGRDCMNRASRFDNPRALFGALSEWNADGDFARVLTTRARDGNLVRRTNSEWGHRRRCEERPVDGDQHVAPLDAGEMGWTVLEDVLKVPALPTITLKGADGRIDRVLGQKPAGSLVVEDSMATAEFRQGFAYPTFEFPNVYIEQGKRSLVKPLGPLVVVHTSHIEVLLEDALLDRSQDLSARLWT